MYSEKALSACHYVCLFCFLLTNSKLAEGWGVKRPVALLLSVVFGAAVLFVGWKRSLVRGKPQRQAMVDLLIMGALMGTLSLLQFFLP